MLYLANVIAVPPQVVCEVKQLITDFLWDNKPPKIAYNVMIQSIENGGMNLVDFDSKVKSLRVSFVKRLLYPKAEKWKTPPSYFYDASSLELLTSSESVFFVPTAPCKLWSRWRDLCFDRGVWTLARAGEVVLWRWLVEAWRTMLHSPWTTCCLPLTRPSGPARCFAGSRECRRIGSASGSRDFARFGLGGSTLSRFPWM